MNQPNPPVQRPREPFGADGKRRPPWAQTHPLALYAIGLGAVAGGIFFIVSPFVNHNPHRDAVVVSIVFGVVLIALGIFSVIHGRMRARWQRDVAEWERLYGKGPVG